MKALFMALMLTGFAAAAATPDAASRQEIDYLLNHLSTSNCQFFRNGSWYGSERAKSHVETKYRYLLRRGKIDDAEDFIRLAASRSSRSGRAYQVRCGDEKPVPSADWLGEKLERYRTLNS